MRFVRHAPRDGACAAFARFNIRDDTIQQMFSPTGHDHCRAFRGQPFGHRFPDPHVRACDERNFSG
jgi:hypothetical protein